MPAARAVPIPQPATAPMPAARTATTPPTALRLTPVATPATTLRPRLRQRRRCDTTTPQAAFEPTLAATAAATLRVAASLMPAGQQRHTATGPAADASGYVPAATSRRFQFRCQRHRWQR